MSRGRRQALLIPCEAALAYDREHGWHLLAAPPQWWLEEMDAGRDVAPTSSTHPYVADGERSRLTKGQRAMVTMMASTARTLSWEERAQRAGVSSARLGQASTVLGHAPDLVDAVLTGKRPLNEVYAEARRRKATAGPEGDAGGRPGASADAAYAGARTP